MAVVDPNKLRRNSRDETSVGRKFRSNHPGIRIVFEWAKQSPASRERPDIGSPIIRAGRDFRLIWRDIDCTHPITVSRARGCLFVGGWIPDHHQATLHPTDDPLAIS